MPASCPSCAFPMDPGVATSCPRCGAVPGAEAISGAWNAKTEAAPAPDPVMLRSAGIAFDRASTKARASSASSSAPLLSRAQALAIDAGVVAAASAIVLAAGAWAFGLADIRARGDGALLPGLAAILRGDLDVSVSLALVVLAIVSAYAIWFLGATGRTPGMASAGLVAQQIDGKPLGFSGAVSRWGAVLLSLIPLGLGLLWTVFDEDGRGLHDRLAGTRVVIR